MGYRSDVTIAAAFDTKDHMEEIVAVYRMNPAVQKYNLMGSWKLCPDNDPPYMVCELSYVKWYETYEYVKAFYNLFVVCDDFANERGFDYAYILLRIGEDADDTETDEQSSDDGWDLLEYLRDSLFLVRRIDNSL